MRATTLKQLIENLRNLVDKNPNVGDAIVISQHSSSGALDHINSFRVHTIQQYDIDSEFGFFYEDENLNSGDTVILLSVGGN